MKLAVIASPEDGELLLDILGTLEKVNVDAYGLKMRGTWMELPRERIAAHLDKATHYLVLATPGNLRALWLPYAAGYSHGKGAHIACCRPSPAFELPGYLAGLPVLDRLDELGAYYQAERAEWLVGQDRRVARSTLLEMGISCHAESLAKCAHEGNLGAVELFMRAGFLPDSRDRHGVTLLCLAARGRHRGVAELLMERGAAVDIQSEDRGFSPLMDAVHAGSAELVDLFLSRGADPGIESKDGQSALVIAVGRNDADIAGRLLARGADPDQADKLGLSARKYAALFKDPAVLRLFGPIPSPPPA